MVKVTGLQKYFPLTNLKFYLNKETNEINLLTY